ncbi:MAG: hypothetical protein OXC40_03435 [Proteobacteria bacterium]|nr:hypothetical protein [Pseudomonadota bacterium]
MRFVSCVFIMLSCSLFLSNISIAAVKFLPEGLFVATGDRIYLNKPPISLNTLPTWQGYYLPDSGLTLKMEGKREKIDLGTKVLRFKPSLIVRTLRWTEPIDHIRKKSFIAALKEEFTQNNPLNHFQILGAQLINYPPSNQDEPTPAQKKKPALLVYSSYVSHHQNMIQIHMLVAGKKEQYAMTYTDHDRLFRSDHKRAQHAWNTLYSLRYDGEPMARYAKLKIAFSLGMVMFLLMFLPFFVAKLKDRRTLKLYLRRIKREQVKHMSQAKKKAKQKRKTQELFGKYPVKTPIFNLSD